MTYEGIVHDGLIVLEPGTQLPEGATVRVELVETGTKAAETVRAPTLREKLLALAGTIDGLPEDMSVNLDHYLYGSPKQSEREP